MSVGVYAFNDGHKCFPGRTLLQGKEGADHWLMAYRKVDKQKYMNVHRKETYKKCKNSQETETETPHGNTLDGPLLLKLHCVDEPYELCSVNISEQNLNSVKAEDLKFFHNIAYMDASINSLSLDSFRSFVSLRELDLSLNGLCDMTFHAADFPHLEVLDFSFNSLSAEDVVSIGRLPRLKVLHLTGNQLHHLPPNLGSSSCEPTQLETYDTFETVFNLTKRGRTHAPNSLLTLVKYSSCNDTQYTCSPARPAKEDNIRFEALEVLMLDDNKLSSGVFNSLKNLQRLKYLNLRGNRISEIPYLQLTSVEERVEEEEEPAHKEPNPTYDEHLKRISQIFHKENSENYSRGSSMPLPELQFLNLANNKFAEEEALMAAALFPMLREVDIHSNPLTTQRSGDPPLLTYYLQERLGITIKRKKAQEAVKLPLKVYTHPEWKVEERIPKVSKKPMLMDAARPAHVKKRDATIERTPESEGKSVLDDVFQENTENVFFVTQATDAHEYESDLEAVEKETADNERGDDAIPEELCYTMLMGAEPNPDVVEDIGIQTAVRMLEHTLKNLNVYRDSKPKLDCLQTPYKEREKKIKPLPPLKAKKQPAERLDEMIKEIRATTTMREVPLSDAIRGAGVEKREALSLLRDMRRKYKMVHQKTMEQAASMGSDRDAKPMLADVECTFSPGGINQ